MGTISAYSEYINWETMRPIIFSVFTDKSIIVRLKCRPTSYCPFYMQITSIVVFYMV